MGVVQLFTKASVICFVTPQFATLIFFPIRTVSTIFIRPSITLNIRFAIYTPPSSLHLSTPRENPKKFFKFSNIPRTSIRKASPTKQIHTMTKSHHCPGMKRNLGGNGRPGPNGSCAAHQIFCKAIVNGVVCGRKHLKNERCPTCGR